MPSYLGFCREVAVEGCGLVLDALRRDEETRVLERSGSERMSRTSLEVIVRDWVSHARCVRMARAPSKGRTGGAKCATSESKARMSW